MPLIAIILLSIRTDSQALSFLNFYPYFPINVRAQRPSRIGCHNDFVCDYSNKLFGGRLIS